MLPVTPRCQDGTCRLAGTPLLKANLTVAAPAFAGTGGAVESLLSRVTVTRPRTPALSPDSPVRAPGLFATGQGEISMGVKVLDKFVDIPFWPGFLDEAPEHSPIPFARVIRTFKARPRMSALCRLC